MEKQNQNPALKDEELNEVTGGGDVDRPLCTLCGQNEQVSAGLCQSCLNKILAEREKKLLVPSPGRLEANDGKPGVNVEGWPRINDEGWPGMQQWTPNGL